MCCEIQMKCGGLVCGVVCHEWGVKSVGVLIFGCDF